jgi:hypothetical protein
MEAVNLSSPSTAITESDKKNLNSLWRWYEKLALFSEKYFIPEWTDKDSQDPDKWPFY